MEQWPLSRALDEMEMPAQMFLREYKAEAPISITSVNFLVREDYYCKHQPVFKDFVFWGIFVQWMIFEYHGYKKTLRLIQRVTAQW